MKNIIGVLAVIFCFALLIPSTAEAGCKMNVYVKNTGTANLVVSPVFVQVKVKGGTWRRLDHADWKLSNYYLHSKSKRGSSYSAALNCKKKRQFRVKYSCVGGKTFWAYYPSSKSFGTKQTLTINLPLCKK